MNYLRFFIVVAIATIMCACSSKPILNQQSLQGTWSCFEYSLTGEGINPTMEAQSKQVALQTAYIFSGDTLTMYNEFFSLVSTYTISADAKEIVCSVIGYQNIQPRIFTIHDFTGEVLILQESQQGIVATNFLQKNK